MDTTPMALFFLLTRTRLMGLLIIEYRETLFFFFLIVYFPGIDQEEHWH